MKIVGYFLLISVGGFLAGTGLAVYLDILWKELIEKCT